jgi:hypothetical protein
MSEIDKPFTRWNIPRLNLENIQSNSELNSEPPQIIRKSPSKLPISELSNYRPKVLPPDHRDERNKELILKKGIGNMNSYEVIQIDINYYIDMINEFLPILKEYMGIINNNGLKSYEGYNILQYDILIRNIIPALLILLDISEYCENKNNELCTKHNNFNDYFKEQKWAPINTSNNKVTGVSVSETTKGKEIFIEQSFIDLLKYFSKTLGRLVKSTNDDLLYKNIIPAINVFMNLEVTCEKFEDNNICKTYNDETLNRFTNPINLKKYKYFRNLTEETAATKIQANVRRRNSRSHASAKRKAAEEARLAAEEAKRKAAEEARLAAEEAKRKAAEEARLAAEEAKQKAAEEAKRKAAEEAKQKAAEEAERSGAATKLQHVFRERKAAEEAKRKAAEEARLAEEVKRAASAKRNAVTKLQSRFRGDKGRKEAKYKKDRMISAKQRDNYEKKLQSEYDRQKQHLNERLKLKSDGKAATKIQAATRGHLDRNKAKLKAAERKAAERKAAEEAKRNKNVENNKTQLINSINDIKGTSNRDKQVKIDELLKKFKNNNKFAEIYTDDFITKIAETGYVKTMTGLPNMTIESIKRVKTNLGLNVEALSGSKTNRLIPLERVKDSRGSQSDRQAKSGDATFVPPPSVLYTLPPVNAHIRRENRMLPINIVKGKVINPELKPTHSLPEF